MSWSAFALVCILATSSVQGFAQYSSYGNSGYGASSSSSSRSGAYSDRGYSYRGSCGGGAGAFGGQGPIAAAIRGQNHNQIEYVDVPSVDDNGEPIDITASPLGLNILFRSASSTLNLFHQHNPAAGDYQESSSEDEPHRLYHTVKKPIYQEVLEIISPVRKITQKIEPVQEQIQTIVAKQSREKEPHGGKLSDDIGKSAVSIGSSPPSYQRSSGDTSGLVRIIKPSVSYHDEHPKWSRQNVDDMYRSSSTPSFLVNSSGDERQLYPDLQPDYQYYHHQEQSPSGDYVSGRQGKTSARNRQMRMNRRHPVESVTGHYGYESLLGSLGHTETSKVASNGNDVFSHRGAAAAGGGITIHKQPSTLQHHQSPNKYSHPWTLSPNQAVQMYGGDSFDDVYRTPGKRNRYVAMPMAEQQMQRPQTATDEETFNMIGYEERGDVQHEERGEVPHEERGEGTQGGSAVNDQKLPLGVKKAPASGAMLGSKQRVLASFFVHPDSGQFAKRFDADIKSTDTAEKPAAELEITRKSTARRTSKKASVGNHEQGRKGDLAATSAGNGAAAVTTRPPLEQSSTEAGAVEANGSLPKKAEVFASKLAAAPMTSNGGPSEGSSATSKATLDTVPSAADGTAVNANSAASTDERK